MQSVLAIDADTLFYDAYSMPKPSRYGFQPVRQLGKSLVPEEISDEILEKGLASVRRRIDQMGERLFGPELKIAVKGHNNFRHDIYPDYKSKRGQNKTILTDLANLTIDLAVDAGWATPSHGYEADDQVRMWAHEAELEGRAVVVAHVDKDLNCIVGRHFNFKGNFIYDVNAESAMAHYFNQLIIGDSVDSIPGARGLGPVKAARFLQSCETEEEYQEAVVEAYMSAHPDDWYESLQLNGQLIHLLRHTADHFTCDNWPVVQALR